MELNNFDNTVRELAFRHAPKQIVQCGDIVTAYWEGWKQSHRVKITNVAVEIASIDLSIVRRAELGLTGWLIVQHQYIGRRLKTNGELSRHPETGFLITEFITADGEKYERIPSGFNHVDLVFEIRSDI
jgi:hypothetical protein